MRLAILPLCLALSGCVVPVSLPTTGAGIEAPTSVAPITLGFADLYDAQRRANGLSAIRQDAGLTAAAQRHADDMARNTFVSHTGSDGSRLVNRLAEQGVCHGVAAENLAWGIPSAQAVVEGWMNSPAHRSNMLLDRVNAYGVAERDGYWVMVLAGVC